MAATAKQIDNITKTTPTARIMLRLFFFALTIRWIYDIALYMALGRNGIMTGDSFGYMRQAEGMAADFLSGQLHGWEWLGPTVKIMPLFPWLAAVNVLAAGALAPLTTVMTLGILDAAACLLIYRTAALIKPRFALSAGIAACVNPTQIVLSGLIYTDTTFFFFVALWLFGAVQWLYSPSWKATLLVAAGLGGAALVRVVIVPWTPVLIIALLIGALIKKKLAKEHLLQLAAVGGIVLACVAPMLSRNVTQYGAWSLTPQGGAHLAFWVLPLVKEGYDGTPWEDSVKQLQAEAERRMPNVGSSPFAQSAYLAQFGREQLKSFGIFPIVKAWLAGAALNLGAPAVILSPAVASLPRTGFYGTRGSSIIGKIKQFLFQSDNKLYALILLIGIAGVAAIRLVQLAGLITLLRDRNAVLASLLLCLWAGYILAINGPVASPKYRLPIEPVLMVLTGAGFCTLRDWLSTLRSRKFDARNHAAR